jgi:hypothetical protein
LNQILAHWDCFEEEPVAQRKLGYARSKQDNDGIRKAGNEEGGNRFRSFFVALSALSIFLPLLSSLFQDTPFLFSQFLIHSLASEVIQLELGKHEGRNFMLLIRRYICFLLSSFPDSFGFR